MVRSVPEFIALLRWPELADSEQYRFWNGYRAPFYFSDTPELDGRAGLWTGWIEEVLAVDMSTRESVIRFRMSSGAPAALIGVGSTFEIKEDGRKLVASGKIVKLLPPS